MLHRIIDLTTHGFIRDIDLRYDQPNSSYTDEEGVLHERENELVITAPACQGSERVATFDEHGEFVMWASAKGEYQPKGVE